MQDPSTPAPWRLVILDLSADDRRWLLVTVASADDVRPAEPGETIPSDATAAWLRARTGPARLTVLRSALLWNVERQA